MTFDETILAILELIRKEQQDEDRHLFPLASLITCEQRRQRLLSLLNEAEERSTSQLALLREEVQALPHLPSSEVVMWAKNVLSLPNLGVMEIDLPQATAGESLLRISILDRSGDVVEDLAVRPDAPVSQKAMAIAEHTEAHLEPPLPLHAVWGRIQMALRGRFLISFSLSSLRDRLLDAARRHHLLPLTFLGEDLRPQTGIFFRTEVGYQFSHLCASIGAPLPKEPFACHSLLRAQRDLQIMHLMACGQLHLDANSQPQKGGTDA